LPKKGCCADDDDDDDDDGDDDLMALSVSRACIIDDKTISECAAVDGMRSGRGNRSTR
jgi:hypothetical protein